MQGKLCWTHWQGRSLAEGLFIWYIFNCKYVQLNFNALDNFYFEVTGCPEPELAWFFTSDSNNSPVSLTAPESGWTESKEGGEDATLYCSSFIRAQQGTYQVSLFNNPIGSGLEWTSNLSLPHSLLSITLSLYLYFFSRFFSFFLWFSFGFVFRFPNIF